MLKRNRERRKKERKQGNTESRRGVVDEDTNAEVWFSVDDGVVRRIHYPFVVGKEGKKGQRYHV